MATTHATPRVTARYGSGTHAVARKRTRGHADGVGRSLGSSGPDGVVARAEISAHISGHAPPTPTLDLRVGGRRSVASEPQICRHVPQDLGAKSADLSPASDRSARDVRRSVAPGDRSVAFDPQISARRRQISGWAVADLRAAARDLRPPGRRSVPCGARSAPTGVTCARPVAT